MYLVRTGECDPRLRIATSLVQGYNLVVSEVKTVINLTRVNPYAKPLRRKTEMFD
eukprot:COSAG02_NODE_43044_length_378_cov_1.480287_1_plen_55_part_00